MSPNTPSASSTHTPQTPPSAPSGVARFTVNGTYYPDVTVDQETELPTGSEWYPAEFQVVTWNGSVQKDTRIFVKRPPSDGGDYELGLKSCLLSGTGTRQSGCFSHDTNGTFCNENSKPKGPSRGALAVWPPTNAYGSREKQETVTEGGGDSVRPQDDVTCKA